ncbi:MAG: hypothetical protein QF639_02530, partial [Rhodospirillales bacterium]|nr:hypothetical protein [Rhodospirillales bacterium]
MDANEFLESDIKVVNIGLESFARELGERGVPTVHVEWSPPAAHPPIRDRLPNLGSGLGPQNPCE